MVVIAPGARIPAKSRLKGIRVESVMVAMEDIPDMAKPQCRGLRNSKMRRDGSFKAASQGKMAMAPVCISLVAQCQFSHFALIERSFVMSNPGTYIIGGRFLICRAC